ncbi:MAG: UbiA family prenyltransferase, partial [Actinomycetota bacterium]
MLSLSRARDWADLVRLPSVLTVPGDVLIGASVAAGRRPGARDGARALASCLVYLGGMALNDWADREVDARERPHRPIPSGRIGAGAALGAAAGLTAAALAVSGAAG